MTTYAEALTIRDARAQYFAENGFGDGGYTAKWVKLQAGPIPLFFPNTASRVRAVRFHDLHHVVTGYDTKYSSKSNAVFKADASEHVKERPSHRLEALIGIQG